MSLFVLNSNGFVIGSIQRIESGPATGFRFLPHVQRSPSRKSWPTAEASLPRWVKKTGCEIVEATIDEATRLGGIWRSEGLEAMRAAAKVAS